MSDKKENFEELMKKLETTVQVLEKGELNLDESVAEFEKGMEMAKTCNQMLEEAEKKITILLQNDDKITEENFVSEE